MKLPVVVLGEEIVIEKLVPGGQGIAVNKDGLKGFFWNVLPGEIVTEYEITKKKSHFFEATATKIKNNSPHRITPKDSCYLSTSPWQIMDYNFELEQKSLLLEEIFRQHNIPDFKDIHPIATDNQDFFYRNKMEYALYYDYEDEKLHLGFHKRGTHRKIKVGTSSIERPEIFKRATEIIDNLNANHADGRKYQSLLLRTNQNGQVEGGLFENHQPHPTFKKLTDTILGHKYSYSPNGFFQINLPVYEMALEEIKKHIKTEDVLDLYAGVGTIGLSVAKDKNLTLVEVDKSAFAELEKNIAQQEQLLLSWGASARPVGPSGLPRPKGRSATGEPRYSSPCQAPDPLRNAKAILAKAENVLDQVTSNQTIIVDPPRAGLDKKLIERLLSVIPPTIIYLSCNPVTQARDLESLTEKYKITTIKPYNFFPRTPHLENLVVLERK